MKNLRAIIYLILFLAGLGLLVYFISNLINAQLTDTSATTTEQQAANVSIPASNNTPASTDSTVTTTAPIPVVADNSVTTAQVAATDTTSTPATEVTTVKLASANNAYVTAIGTVKSKATLDLFPQTSGSVKKVNFQEGDYVNAGDTIIELTGNNLTEHPSETQLKVAEQTLANAKDSYNSLQKTSNESLKTANLQLQSAVNQASAIAYDLGVIEQNKAGLQDSLNILQDSLNNTQQKNARDDAYGKNNIDHLIYNLNQAQNDRGQTQIQLDALNSEADSLNVDPTADPKQVEALIAEQTKLQATLDAQSKGINDLYDAIDKAKYGLNTAENGAALTDNQIQAQIASAQSQSQVFDLNLQSTKTKLGYTGDSSDGLQLAQQAYNATKVQLQTALDNAANQIKLAQLSVDLAKNSASGLQIKAPFSGVITALDLVPGESVTPQANVAEIIDPHNFELEIGVDSATADRIATGMAAQISLAGHAMDVPIKSISNKVDEKTKLVKVTLVLPNIFFKVNQTLTAQLPIISGSTNGGAIYLPLDAVIIGTESQFVYINDNGKAKQVQIKMGNIEGDQVEILGGLYPNAEVILSGAKSLTDGQSIEVKN